MKSEANSPTDSSLPQPGFTRAFMQRKTSDALVEAPSKLRLLNMNQANKMATTLADFDHEELNLHPPQSNLRSLPALTSPANRQQLLEMFPLKGDNQDTIPIVHEALPKNASLKHIKILNQALVVVSRKKKRRNTKVMYMYELWARSHYKDVVENTGIQKLMDEAERARRLPGLRRLKSHESAIDENSSKEKQEGDQGGNASNDDSLDGGNKIQERRSTMSIESPEMGVLESENSLMMSPPVIL